MYSGMHAPNGLTLVTSMQRLLIPFCSSETQSTTLRLFVMPSRCPKVLLALSSYAKIQKDTVLVPASGKFLLCIRDCDCRLTSISVSFCTTRAARTYLQTGKLPEEGTVCQPDLVPLSGLSKMKNPPLPEGETDEELWRAIVGVNYRNPVIPVL